jgi:hypothetical protein
MQESQDENNLEKQPAESSNQNWDEGSFARLLGLDEEVNKIGSPSEIESVVDPISETNSSNQFSHNVIAQDEIFDNPQLGKTQPTFASNPFAKFGAVGLVMLVIFGAGATFLNTIMSGTPKVAPKITATGDSKPKVEIAPDANPQSSETGKLKAELALGTQAEKIKSLERSKNPKAAVGQRKIKSRNDLNRRTPSQIASREVRPPAQISYIPPSYPSRYSVSRDYTPRVAQRSRLEQTVANATPTFNKTPVPSGDPMLEWSKINRLGSYGSSEIASANIASATKEQLNNNVVSQQPTSPINIPRATPVLTVSNETVETLSSLEPLHAEEAVIINSLPSQQLMVGTTASAKLVTPIVWGKRLTNNTDKSSQTPTKGEKFIVQLTEPLSTESGFVSLPKGSQIVAQVTDIQKSGLVQLEATQVVIDSQEYVLPPGAISIRGNSGQPLIASLWGDKGGEIASQDAQTFVVGSLAKVGKVQNLPKEEQISTSSGFGGTTTFSSTRQGRTNILGAFMEGGFQPLTQQILERNQRSLAQIQQREQAWYIKAGTNVQIFVNQSFQF